MLRLDVLIFSTNFSLRLFLDCSYFSSIFLPSCYYKVCSYKKKKRVLKDKIVIMKCCITGESMSAREGSWNVGGGIEVLCRHEPTVNIEIKKRKEKRLKKRLDKLKPAK